MAFLVTYPLSRFATGWLAKFLQQYTILDRPNHRSSHTRPVPRGGGIVVIGMLVLAWGHLGLLVPYVMPALFAILGCTLALAALSWIDDLRGLNPFLRLFGQAIAVVIGLWALPDAPVFQGIFVPWVDSVMVAVLWLWFINLFNFMDGIDGISSLAVNYANTPAEVIEVEQPLRIERYGFLADTAGAGQHRGSLSIVRAYRLVDADEAVLQVRGDRQKFQPVGLQGGAPGAHARGIINPDRHDAEVPPGKFMTTMHEGDVFQAVLAGGGGWGDPLERDPARVLDDVLNEKVSPQAAEQDYGVVLDARARRVEAAAPRELRGRKRSAAP